VAWYFGDLALYNPAEPVTADLTTIVVHSYTTDLTTIVVHSYTTDLTTIVVHSYKLLINDVKPVHLHQNMTSLLTLFCY